MLMEKRKVKERNTFYQEEFNLLGTLLMIKKMEQENFTIKLLKMKKNNKKIKKNNKIIVKIMISLGN